MIETKIWQVTYVHPGRTYGSTVFYVKSKEYPTDEKIIQYMAEYLGEEYDENFEGFYVVEFHFNPDSLVNLDEMESE